MPRPSRALWVTRAYARRRHRSWHLAMILATLGWGTWWCALFVHRLAPEREIPLALPATISTVAAILGLAVAVLTLRAGSVLPAIALHVTYNALATYGALRGGELVEATQLLEWTRAAWLPALALPGLALLAWAGRRPTSSATS